MHLDQILDALENCWGPDTAQDADPMRGPASGQCAVSSMLIQMFFGGRIMRGITNTNVVHYWNELPDGQWIDSTRAQFSEDEYIQSQREAIVKEYLFNDTIEKYNILNDRVRVYLKKVYGVQ